MTQVTVIICTYSLDRYNDTLDAVNSILCQNSIDREIILVIDGNGELFNKLLDFYGDTSIIKILHNVEVPGLSGSRNFGIKYSTGDIIAFLDDDAIANNEWLRFLLDTYEKEGNELIGCGGPINPLWISGEAEWIPEELYWTMGCTHMGVEVSKRNVRSNFGSNMSFRKQAFKFACFNPKYGLIGNIGVGEELELSLKLLQNFPNARILFVPEAIVYHKIFDFRKSLKHVFRRCYQYGKSIAKFSQKLDSLPDYIEKDDSLMKQFIFFNSVPMRIVGLFQKDDQKSLLKRFTQLCILFLSFTVVYSGIFIGKINFISNHS